MAKAFLSHSSFDKDFVEKVFDELGAGRCVYDKGTFRKNCDLAHQIREGVEGCEVYALFLSEPALRSKWVTAELDLASELKTQWKVQKVLVFQLDETRWDTLPAWMGRYVVSCPPSPHQVALRLLDELQPQSTDDHICHGRSEEERKIVDQLAECTTPPSYLYLSGPIGIGRRTLASAVYASYYPDIARHKIEIRISAIDDIIDIYQRALAYSANWRASDYKAETDRISNLSTIERAKELAALLRTISTTFRQVVVLDLGTAGLTEEGRPQLWFMNLTKFLTPADYPYVWFTSQRFLNGSDLANGLFFGVEPLDQKWSTFLFRVLIKKYAIAIPSKDEQQRIENSISGHPGLITMVANYLRKNPQYKPNRTHNNIVRLINEQVQMILLDFIGNDTEKEKAVAFYSEAHILSYEEIQLIAKSWPTFEESTASLLDAGLLVRAGPDYSLASYIQRPSELFATKHRSALAEMRKVLLAAYDSMTGDSYLPLQLLEPRIVSHILEGIPIGGYLSNLVMPCQQLRAAKRRYDAQDFSASLTLAKEAYSQAEKLSENGRREAWRLIGLSSIRADDQPSFQMFLSEYPKLKKSPQTDAIYCFGNGLKERLSGNLRNALQWYKKIKQEKYADSHVYRELAYIYAFERSFDDAYACITRAHDLALGNPYVLDILAMILLEKYRTERRGVSIGDIDRCLEQLKAADDRDGTHFYGARSKMRDVIVNNDIGSLQDLFASRRNLPIAAKIALLSMLAIKGKDLQFNELHGELVKTLREKRNPLAQIEMARTDIEYLCLKQQYSEARKLLLEHRSSLTERCCEELERLLPHSAPAHPRS